jgi:drug/metabolite transporter (DMT)-like permease
MGLGSLMVTQPKKAYLFGLITVLLWSTVATAFKLSLRYLDHLQLLFYASLSSILVLALLLLIQGKVYRLFSASRRDYLLAVLLGFLNPFLYYVVLFKAYTLLPAQEAQPLNYTWALTLMLFSVLWLKQRLRVSDGLAGVVGYLGVWVIATRGNVLGLEFSNPGGVALALGSTVIWSLYWIINQKRRLDPVVGLFLNFVGGFPFILAACLVFSRLSVTHPYGLYGALYVGIFEMGITFVCWLLALKYAVNTARVGNLIFLSPFLSLVFIRFLVGEPILPSTLVGLGFITASLLLQRWPKAAPDGLKGQDCQ